MPLLGSPQDADYYKMLTKVLIFDTLSHMAQKPTIITVRQLPKGESVVSDRLIKESALAQGAGFVAIGHISEFHRESFR